jgi:hypothetical protein
MRLMSSLYYLFQLSFEKLDLSLYIGNLNSVVWDTYFTLLRREKKFFILFNFQFLLKGARRNVFFRKKFLTERNFKLFYLRKKFILKKFIFNYNFKKRYFALRKKVVRSFFFHFRKRKSFLNKRVFKNYLN